MRRAAIALLVAALLVARCKPEAPATSAPSPARPAPEALAITVVTDAGARHVVRAELADTLGARAQGLMYREQLAPDAGMLFLMPGDDDWGFYMKNTLLPLDMIFIDQAGVIVGIVEDTRPLDEATRSVGRPSRYVLEVNGRWCRDHGVAVGDRIELPGRGGRAETGGTSP
jgi:uncharacterized protein